MWAIWRTGTLLFGAYTISIIFGQIFHRECKKVKKTAFMLEYIT